MERSQRSGHCCPELCPHYSSTGNEPRTTVLYGNNSASCFFFFFFFFTASLPFTFRCLRKLLNVRVEAAGKNTSERVENRGESTSTGPTLQPVTFSVICTAHIWCTMAEQPPNHFKQNWPRFGYSWRAVVSCAGGISVHFIVLIFFFFLTDMNGKGHEVGSKSESNDLEGPGYGL